jgi:hypothetical protein
MVRDQHRLTIPKEIRTYYIDDGRAPDALQAAVDYARALAGGK